MGITLVKPPKGAQVVAVPRKCVRCGSPRIKALERKQVLGKKKDGSPTKEFHQIYQCGVCYITFSEKVSIFD